MTNEELVELAQAGDTGALLKLWERVRRLAWKKMRRWTWAGPAAGMEPEDFEQVAFLALLLAVRGFTYDGRAKFSTWYCIRLKSEVFNAAGLHGEKARRDPLRSAVSLDRPASPDAPEDVTLADIIPDPAAEEPFLVSDLEAVVEEALASLPPEQWATIRVRYWMGEAVDAKAHADALRSLRHPSRSKRLRAFVRKPGPPGCPETSQNVTHKKGGFSEKVRI